MKPSSILAALLIAIAPAAAAETKKPPAKKTEPPAKKMEPPAKKPEPAKKPARTKTDMIEEDAIAVLKAYDKDANFEIDVDEFEIVQAEFKKKPFGPLRQFDKGKDGSLDVMIDRIGMNVKLGAGAPKTKPKPAPKPGPPAPPKPAAPPAAKPGTAGPEVKPAAKPAPASDPKAK